MGGQAFYGYKMDPNHKKKIIVDENVRHIIEMIFQMCIDGSTTRQIASYLNQYKNADDRSKALTGRLIRLEEKLAVDMRPYL